jgi:hypothetical protein
MQVHRYAQCTMDVRWAHISLVCWDRDGYPCARNVMFLAVIGRNRYRRGDPRFAQTVILTMHNREPTGTNRKDGAKPIPERLKGTSPS